ncbi:MAG: hypothetical protein ACOZCF_02515 [Bacillota bacterium]
MFTAFYSLSAKPFPKEIKANELFPSASHNELLARLDYLDSAEKRSLPTTPRQLTLDNLIMV